MSRAVTSTRCWVFAGLVLIGCLGATVASSAGSEAIKMRVRPSPVLNSGYVRIMVSVEPDAENRKLVIVADSPNFYRSSEFTLDGEDAARTHWIEWNSLPAGSYEVEAVVRGTDGRRAAATQRMTIFGFDHSDGPLAIARTTSSVR